MPTTTTTDYTQAIPLLQRTYHTVNNGVPVWAFVFCFVFLTAAVFVLALAVSRKA